MSSRKAAMAALAMYSAVRPRAALAQRAARLGIALFGPHILPGATSAWVRPMPDETWHGLEQRWRRSLGEFDTTAVYERVHENRPGLALLLLRDGRPISFVKVRSTDTRSLTNEAAALQAVWRAQPRTFCVAEPLDAGNFGEWHYLAMAPLPPLVHRAVSSAPIHSILAELRLALTSHPQPDGMAPHWEPMHGDFTPWNLRELHAGTVALIDWEYAAWGPPGADEVLYRASQAAVAGNDPGRTDRHEAVQFWTDRIKSWPETKDRDGRLLRSVLQMLDRMVATN